MTSAPDALTVDHARALVAAQFPRWAHLPLTPVASAGTDNALFRLGRDMMVRLPKAEWARHLIVRESKILPRLVGRLPLAIPELVAIGEPTEAFPHAWSILSWIDGESVKANVLDNIETATTLARFVRTLQRVEPPADLSAGPANGFRGASLRTRDSQAREAIATLADEIDTRAALALWNQALAVQPHATPGTWVHGDVHPGNVLTQSGKLAAGIDWGMAAIGDPAIDLMPAWSMFSGTARAVFHNEVDADASTWLRARGWVLSVSVIALAYYRGRNAAITTATRRDIAEVLVDS